VAGGDVDVCVANSKFASICGTRTYVSFEGDGFKLTTETVNADGTRTTTTGSGHYDGKDYPNTDQQNRCDTVAFKRIDECTT